MNLELLRYALAAAVLTAATAAAQGFAPPADLPPGSPYRVMFLTSAGRDALSTNIADYNAFVAAQAAAAPDLAALGTSWQAVASTESVDARTNTATDPTPTGSTGVPIYTNSGIRIADNYDGLWSGSLLAGPFSGSSRTVWTGTAPNGLTSTRPLGGTTAQPTLSPILGMSEKSNSDWITSVFFGPFDGARVQRPFYGISNTLGVPLEAPPDLDPGEPYRVLVVTDSTRDALSTDIADYNSFVAMDANSVPELAALNASWFAVGSTATVLAPDNTGTNASASGIQGVPIYRRDGVRLADNYDDLWDGMLAAAPNITASGQTIGGGCPGPLDSRVWTGAIFNGALSQSGGAQFPLGNAVVRAGAPGCSNFGWMSANELGAGPPRAMYALSSVLTAPPQAGVETIRAGILPNPRAFLRGQTSRPITGQTWDPAIDHTNFVPAATFDFILIAGAPLDLDVSVIATGNLLCDIGPWHVAISNFTPGSPFAVAVPNSAVLVGDMLCVQGGSFDMGLPAVHFANAIDVVIGSL